MSLRCIAPSYFFNCFLQAFDSLLITNKNFEEQLRSFTQMCTHDSCFSSSDVSPWFRLMSSKVCNTLLLINLFCYRIFQSFCSSLLFITYNIIQTKFSHFHSMSQNNYQLFLFYSLSITFSSNSCTVPFQFDSINRTHWQLQIWFTNNFQKQVTNYWLGCSYYE